MDQSQGGEEIVTYCVLQTLQVQLSVILLVLLIFQSCLNMVTMYEAKDLKLDHRIEADWVLQTITSQTWNIVFMLLAFELVSVLFIIKSQKRNVNQWLYEFNHEDVTRASGAPGFKRREIRLKRCYWVTLVLVTITNGFLQLAIHLYPKLKWFLIGILLSEMFIFFILWIKFYLTMQ